MVRHDVERMTWKEYQEVVKREPVAIIPVGVLEEHGPHLPLATDTMQALHISHLLADEYDGDVLVYPPINYGVCRTCRNFPGSVSLRFETMKAVVKDVIKEIHRNGVKKIIILSGHAGRIHMAALRDAGHECIEECDDLRLIVLSDYEIAYDLKGKMFDERDGHAGTIETSRMMLIDESLVKESIEPSFERPPKFHILRSPEKYFPSGIMGDPSSASVEKGKKIDEYIIKRLIEEMKRWEV